MASFDERFIRMQFGGKARLGVYRKLIQFLGTGVPITSALDSIYAFASEDGRKPKGATAVAVDTWRKQIKNGKSLGTAVTGWVPDNDRIVIEAGTSDLPKALKSACLLQESQSKIRAALVAGLAYPIILVMVAFGFLILFGTNVIPQFESVLPKAEWEGLGWQMGLMSDMVQSYMIPFVVMLVAATCVVVWSFPRWTGPARVRIERMPPYSLYRLMAGSGFLLSMAALLRSGVKTTSALELLGRNSTPWYGERISRTLALVRNGNSLGDALHKSRMNFPDRETVSDLRAYSKLEGFEDILLRIGEENLDETVKKIKAQSAVMNLLGIILMGGVFIWIYLGLFSLVEQIKAHAT